MLKQIRLKKTIELKKESLAVLIAKREGIKTRTSELEVAISEAKTDEDIKLIDEQIAEVEKENTENETAITAIETEISGMETEIRTIMEQANTAKTNNPAAAETRSINNKTESGGIPTMGNKYETRVQHLERLKLPEVNQFYSNLATAVKEKRALSGTDLLIPEVIVNMIQLRLGDYNTLYKEVRVMQLAGEARVILNGAIPEAIWVECCDPVTELASAFTQTELDCYKVCGYISICNATLEDSFINLSNYIEELLALAISKAIDKAILTGVPASHQPTGIIPSIPAENKTTSSGGKMVDIMKSMSLLDTGNDGSTLGEVIAVMTRKTYYTYIAPQTLLTTSAGKLTIQTTNGAALADGTRIVFSQYVPADVIIMGDFKSYLLGERKGLQMAVSEHVKFIEDQTLFKATARYDGKPIYPSKFAQITITA